MMFHLNQSQAVPPSLGYLYRVPIVAPIQELSLAREDLPMSLQAVQRTRSCGYSTSNSNIEGTNVRSGTTPGPLVITNTIVQTRIHVCMQ